MICYLNEVSCTLRCIPITPCIRWYFFLQEGVDPITLPLIRHIGLPLEVCSRQSHLIDNRNEEKCSSLERGRNTEWDWKTSLQASLRLYPSQPRMGRERPLCEIQRSKVSLFPAAHRPLNRLAVDSHFPSPLIRSNIIVSDSPFYLRLFPVTKKEESLLQIKSWLLKTLEPDCQDIPRRDSTHSFSWCQLPWLFHPAVSLPCSSRFQSRRACVTNSPSCRQFCIEFLFFIMEYIEMSQFG